MTRELVPDKFAVIMARAGRPLRHAPVSVAPRVALGLAVAKLRALVGALGEDCVGVRGEELADVLELVYVIGEHAGWTKGTLETMRMTRRAVRGGYDAALTWDREAEQ